MAWLLSKWGSALACRRTWATSWNPVKHDWMSALDLRVGFRPFWILTKLSVFCGSFDSCTSHFMSWTWPLLVAHSTQTSTNILSSGSWQCMNIAISDVKIGSLTNDIQLSALWDCRTEYLWMRNLALVWISNSHSRKCEESSRGGWCTATYLWRQPAFSWKPERIDLYYYRISVGQSYNKNTRIVDSLKDLGYDFVG